MRFNGQREIPVTASSITNHADLARFVNANGGGPHYVYVLRFPDMSTSFGGVGTPFYVGIGQGARLFSHEEEARDTSRSSAKVETIRSIWESGGKVVRTIDSVHAVEPWLREEELIAEIGRLADGTGPLTNAQTYAPSFKINGIEHRKYAADHNGPGEVNSIPAKFKLRHTRIMAGPRKPISRTSVFGKIYDVVEANPGVTGEELVELLRAVDFSGNKSAYTQGGQVSSSWLVGYIEGGYFRSDRQHLQEFT